MTTATTSSDVDTSLSSSRLAAASAKVAKSKRPKGMKGFVWDYIVDRIDRQEDDDDENLERILTSDVWYDLVDENKNTKWKGALAKYYMAEHNGQSIKGREASKARVRETIISYIKDVCDELKIRRADVNILAGDVGYLYFRGERHAISLDDLDKLKLYGTDVQIIEKQGVTETLYRLAAPSGVALLSTRGFLTENALDLSAFASSSGANTAILTDDDISGRVIAHKVPNVPRIGIDFNTLEDLGISELAEGEYYTPDKGHLKYAEENMPDLEDLNFLRTRRIEINAVKNKVGPERLWNWILNKLDEQYPNRNYNRAIRLPESYYFRPPELDQVNTLIDNRINQRLQPEIDRCRYQLCNYQGFIDDVSDYEQDLSERFEYVLNGGGGNNGMTKNFLKNVRKDLAKLVKKYDGGIV